MNFQNPYSRSEYKKFFQDSLLTDSFRVIEEVLSLEFKPSFIKKAELIGRDKSLELEVYEIEHSSENDPRVGLSKDIFRLMANYGSKRALAIFYSHKSKNYRLSLATVDLSLEGSKVKREYSNPRRYSFFLGSDAKVHTPSDFLIKKGRVKDFDDLQNRFSIEVVNKEFYKEIANWYFWTLKKVKFPDDVETEKNGREISVIRLITRLIFIWFMKVRKLIPEELFSETSLKEILTDLKLNNDNYYKAILQNLFFATLNAKSEERRFTSKKKGYKGYSQDFGNHNVYRYEELFNDSEEAIEKHFMSIPFLNGGLFECLDYKSKIRDERKYIDGFTSTKSQQPSAPNFLFFSEDKTVDLNKDYGSTNKKYNVRGLIKTLSLYNFTIDENDPNDADVSLDPELLGKVFENLLASYNPETAKTARKSTGSYYTPRPIVDYMVDESLKQYFKTHIEVDDIDNKLILLFSAEEHSSPFDKKTTEQLVLLIDNLRIVDPAVGSGAFPMRILNRLVFLLHKLDPDNTLWKQYQIDGIKKSVKDPILQRKFIEETERKFKEKNPDYGRKLYLIEKCIYGVDIQQIAVEIAKLRFFISLLVDEKVENGEIEPLPNLDFKLMQGNSLISSFAGIDFNAKTKNEDQLFDFDINSRQLIVEFEELKSQYQNEPEVKKKNNLREQIDNKLLEIFEEKLKQHFPQLNELENKYAARKDIIEAEKKKLFKKIGIDVDQAKQDLIAYTEGRKQKDFFLWDVYFAEVFADKGGFDIVIGNPPYISISKLDSPYKILVEKKGYETFEKTGDIYTIFYENGYSNLKDKGVVTFITSRQWIHSAYGKSFRQFLTNFTNPLKIIDFGKIKIFEAATVFVNILLVQKYSNINELLGCEIKSDFNVNTDSISEYFSNNSTQLNNLNSDTWKIGSKAEVIINSKIESLGIPLEEMDVQFYAGIKTAYNPAFHITAGIRNELIRKDANNKKIIKPLLRGKDIKRYFYNYQNIYLINSHNGVRELEIPSIDVIKDYPTIYEYLKQYKKHLTTRQDQGDHWTNLRNCAFIKEFEKEKIVWLEISDKANYDYDDRGMYLTNSAYFLTGKNLKYILAVLNCKLSDYYFFQITAKIAGGRKRYTKQYVGQVRIPDISINAQKPFINLVDKILTAKKQNPQPDTQQLEDQIDIMAYTLYNLTYEEVKIIDPEIEKIISETEYEKFEV